MIKYSVIVPCYNSEKYIINCLQSLANLLIDKSIYELVLVDDCSRDNTVKVIEDFKEKTDVCLQVLKNDINSGPGASRRYGAICAKGEYLFFCDSDDFYNPNFLCDIDVEIEKEGSDLIFFDMSYILRGREIRKSLTRNFEYRNKLSYLSNCTESLCNLVVKRSLFLSIPTIDIRHGEDLALVPLLIINANKITHINNSYYNYVMRGDSASLGKVSENAYENMLLAFEHIRKNIYSDRHDIKTSVEYLGIKTVLYNATVIAIKGNNDNKLLAEIIRNFSQIYPSWAKNPLMKKLGFIKNIYILSLTHKLWAICRLYVSLQTYILSR